jgi:hypothetical protein
LIDTINKHIDHMPDRTAAILAAKGGHTRFWYYGHILSEAYFRYHENIFEIIWDYCRDFTISMAWCVKGHMYIT